MLDQLRVISAYIADQYDELKLNLVDLEDDVNAAPLHPPRPLLADGIDPDLFYHKSADR